MISRVFREAFFLLFVSQSMYGRTRPSLSQSSSRGCPSEEPGGSGGTPLPPSPRIQQPGAEVATGSSPPACEFGAKLLASLSELQLGFWGSHLR